MAQSAPSLLSRLSCTSEIMGLLKLEDDMPADLAKSLKVDEEDRKTDHAPLVQVKANWVASVTASIETNFRLGAVHRTASGTWWWTALTPPKKCHLHHLSASLSVVSRVGYLVCPGPHPCFNVLTTSPRLPDSDKPLCFTDNWT